MIVQCAQCQTKYRFDENQLKGSTHVTFRCTKCGARFASSVIPPNPTPSAEPSPPGKIPEATVVSHHKGGHAELPPGKRVSLSVTQGPLKGQVFSLTKARVILGREGADIVMEDPEVSRKHCAVEVHGSTALLVDLGSTNGTFVDGKRVDTHELEHLSEFRVGSNTLLFTVA